MPVLIPTNTLIPKNNPKSDIQHQSPQSPPQQTPYKISPSDDKLHKDLDDQIQLVKQIQQILGTEQMKLQKLLKEFSTLSIKRKQSIMSYLVKASEKQNNPAKRLRICSPSSINRNLIVNKSDTQTVEKQTDDKNPVDKSENNNSDSPSSCSGGGSPSSTSREKEELDRFRNFWQSSFNNAFEDDEIEIKKKLNTVVIEDLVMEEFDKRKKEDV